MTRRRRLKALMSLREKAKRACILAGFQGEKTKAEQYRKLAHLCDRVLAARKDVAMTPRETAMEMTDRELLIRLDQRVTDLCLKLDNEFPRCAARYERICQLEKDTLELKKSLEDHKHDDRWLYRAAASGLFAAVGAICLAAWHFLTTGK